MMKNEKKFFNQSLVEWKFFIYNLIIGEFLGCIVKSWGLILFFYLVFYGFLVVFFLFMMWVMFQIFNDEVLKYCDQIFSLGFMVFLKLVIVLEYIFSRFDLIFYVGYIEDFKKFLKLYILEEQKNFIVCFDGVFFEQKGLVYVVCQFFILLF